MNLELLLSIIDSNPGWDIVKALARYFGLKDYLVKQYIQQFQPELIHRIYAAAQNSSVSGEALFWSEVFSKKITEGQVVNLIDFQISSWFPRKPGLYWSSSADQARSLAYRRHIVQEMPDGVVFDIHGKTLMSELGGVGCVNFRKNREDVLITATSSGHTERGIPLICPQPIWQSISNELKQNGTIEIDIVGSVEPIPLSYDAYLLRSASIPKFAIRIGSILNIKIRPSRTPIIVTPWTIFETMNFQQPFGFTYVTHDLHEGNLERSVDWIRNYADNYQGRGFVTDFDEELNQLNAQFPLSSCLNNGITDTDVLHYCQHVRDRFDRSWR